MLGLRNGGNLVRSSQQVHRNRKKEWVLKRPATALVTDFTLTDKALPLPDWSLAKVPPINTGDRSEFQMKAVKRLGMDPLEAKSAFDDSFGWKYLDGKRKETPFRDPDEVLDYLEVTNSRSNPPHISKFIAAFEDMFARKLIRING